MARKSVVATTLIAVALIYAVFRYNIVRGVPWEQLPLYITNKGIALSAVLLIALSYVIGPLTRFSPKTFSPWLTTRKYFGLLGFGLAAIHGIISLLIFDPSYYPRFFGENGKLDFNGELSMLFGVISIIIFSVVSISSLNTIEKTIEKKFDNKEKLVSLVRNRIDSRFDFSDTRALDKGFHRISDKESDEKAY